MKTQVSVEYIKHLKEELKKINDLSIFELEFFENGMALDIPSSTKHKFEYTRLSNVDFITSKYYCIESRKLNGNEKTKQ